MDISNISKTLDDLLKNTDVTTSTSEGVNTELPDGYYLAEVTKAELTESKSGNPMVAMVFTTVQDGKKIIVDDDGYTQLIDATNSKNQRIYINYVLSSDKNIPFFVSDMLKFQDPATDEPLFKNTKEENDFGSAKSIANVCDILQESKMLIYIMVQTRSQTNRETGETENVKRYSPISWKRARRLELPM